MKRLILSLFLISILLLSACGSERIISGEIMEQTMNEATGVSSFVVQQEDGKRVGIIMSAETSVWPSDMISAEDFRYNEYDGILVSVTCKNDQQELTTHAGTKLTAYIAETIHITGQLIRGAFTVSDGTEVDLLQYGTGSFSNRYQLRNGTELLYELNPTGPENMYVGGIESFDDLSEVAKKNVSAYYAEQGFFTMCRKNWSGLIRTMSATRTAQNSAAAQLDKKFLQPHPVAVSCTFLPA